MGTASRVRGGTGQCGRDTGQECAELAQGSDVIIDMLQDLTQLEPLLDGPDGLFAGVTEPTVLVVCSTVSPDGVRALDKRARAATKGLCVVVDAPVSGGELKAVDGTLSIMVGGNADEVGPALQVLSACGRAVLCGPLGAGEVVKACNQMVVGIEMAALAEAALLAEGAGVDVALMFDMLSSGLASSAVLDQKHEKVERKDYSTSGAAKFMVKDLRIALGEAGRSGQPLPVSMLALQLYSGLVDAGFGDDDLAVIHRYLGEQPKL